MSNKISFLGKKIPTFLTPNLNIEIKEEKKAWYLLEIQGIYHLFYNEENLGYIDFASSDYRCRGGIEYLPKCFKNLENKRIYDATAGWGKDAWLLAYRGFNITMIEKNPFLYFLLKQALILGKENPKISEIIKKMEVIFSNSLDFFKNNNLELNSAIYLDPMYPERKKTALVKKKMQILHFLLGKVDEENNKNLLLVSKQTKARKIIVKRPKNAEFLGNIIPNNSLNSKNTRYDIYFNFFEDKL